MGNVAAAQPPPPPPPMMSSPGFPMPPPGMPGLVAPQLPPHGASGTTTAGGAAGSGGEAAPRSSLPNPGTYDELHRKCKEVFPAQMEGVRLVINKGLSNHFQVSHTVNLSTVGPSNYHFGTTYVGTKQISPTECFPVIIGDVDNTGSLNAQIIHQLTQRLRGKVALQTQQSKFMTWQFDAEYRGEDYTATVALGNPDVISESMIMVAHYLQSVTEQLTLGGELVYHRRPGEEGAVSTAVARYTGSNWVATLNAGLANIHASYYQKANEQIQVGVELEANMRMEDTACTFGYQIDLPKANMVFRGTVDSNWTVGAVLEKKLPPLPLTLALAAFINHRKNKFQCGFGLTIG
ncbi:mitochondrial import receptor subunit TOM40 homolog [Lethenteron reissneri]|uniref:mitochondrial import receptor subunit TOM40 homolog n=1 Tax=Lethenteron reissneri TaxID=7753 RepID=UPI002AB744B3|nr:mitochondrial import receptor subunit TOM40 homolog [Lethenteron reissneri]